MNRVELRQALAVAHPDLSRQDIQKILRVFFEALTTRLAEGGRVELRGFGSFETRVIGAGPGRNPMTGETIDLPARRFPHFRAGRHLHALINAADAPDLS